MKRKTFFLIFSIILFIACASLEERAEDLMVDGHYEQAIDVYEKALRAEPGKDELKAGLKTARSKWIAQRLIEVRQLRISGDLEESLSLLDATLTDQKKWDISPTGNVAFTQKEESQMARLSIIKLVQQNLRNNHPLKAQYYLTRFPQFFQSPKSMEVYKKLQRPIIQAASKKCLNMGRSLNSSEYFYGQFVERYCLLWQLPSPNLNRAKNRFINQSFSRVSVGNNTQGFPRSFSMDLEKKLQDQLMGSPWYSQDSDRILEMDLSGTYAYEHTQEKTTLTHSYTVSVPYEVQRTEKKRESNNSDQKEKSNSGLLTALLIVGVVVALVAGIAFSNGKSVDNGDGTVTTSETRYREEPRTTTYRATKHSEYFDVKMALQGNLNDRRLRLVRSEHTTNDSISHLNNMSEIGLYPKQANLIGASDWVTNEREAFALDFGQDLKQAWETQNCNSPRFSPVNNRHHLESIFRCLQTSPEKVSENFYQWFQAKHGIDFNKAREILYPHQSLGDYKQQFGDRVIGEL